MRHDWYVVKYKGGKALSKSPQAMDKEEAKMLVAQVKGLRGNEGYVFKAVHRHDVAI